MFFISSCFGRGSPPPRGLRFVLDPIVKLVQVQSLSRLSSTTRFDQNTSTSRRSFCSRSCRKARPVLSCISSTTRLYSEHVHLAAGTPLSLSSLSSSSYSSPLPLSSVQQHRHCYRQRYRPWLCASSPWTVGTGERHTNRSNRSRPKAAAATASIIHFSSINRTVIELYVNTMARHCK